MLEDIRGTVHEANMHITIHIWTNVRIQLTCIVKINR